MNGRELRRGFSRKTLPFARCFSLDIPFYRTVPVTYLTQRSAYQFRFGLLAGTRSGRNLCRPAGPPVVLDTALLPCSSSLLKMFAHLVRKSRYLASIGDGLACRSRFAKDWYPHKSRRRLRVRVK